MPRCLKISTKLEDNDLDCVKQRLRINRVFHDLFDPSLESSEGYRYYSGVLPIDNQNALIKKTPRSVQQGSSPKEDNSQNLYEHIIRTGDYKKFMKRVLITHLRTGFNAKEIKERRN